jgi:hypothetical protein
LTDSHGFVLAADAGPCCRGPFELEAPAADPLLAFEGLSSGTTTTLPDRVEAVVVVEAGASVVDASSDAEAVRGVYDANKRSPCLSL